MKKQREILLVSRDRNLRNAGTGILEAAGHPVHTASSMRDALGILSSEPIGLIVCGLELEDILATDFLAYLKNDPLREAIPFVFYIHSQSQLDLTPRQAANLGADDVILFPVEAAELIRRVQKFLPTAVGPVRNATDTPAVPSTSFVSGAENGCQKSPEVINRDARISIDGKLWAECRVINHTFHGAMVETRLRGKQGESVRLRYGVPEGVLTATGRLMHILLGDHERPIGMGINFRGDASWRRIHSQIKSTGKTTPPVSKASPAEMPMPSPSSEPEAPKVSEERILDQPVIPEFPIGIDISRNGQRWMHGEIATYDKTGASIITPLLGKSGETLHVRVSTPGDRRIFKGRIKQVALNNFKRPAGMELTFPENSQWTDIITRIANEATNQEGNTSGEEKTAVIKNASIIGENVKNRFYKSLIGKKLGKYGIVSFLDAGGMGGVFMGWDGPKKRKVAVKVISFDLSIQKEYVEMLFKETRLVSNLSHPNITHIYAIGIENGIVYYAMEFIKGCTLAELMIKDRPIRPDKAVAYLTDVCRALDRAGQEEIIHRSINPANIMISENETVKLLNFGKMQPYKSGPDGDKNNISGPPAYLSPELIRGEATDFRSDIYSLGATIYHALYGSPPFTDNTVEGIIRKHLKTPPAPLKEKMPSLPAPISDALQKMLAKNPEDRFQSYEEIISALAPTPPLPPEKIPPDH